MKMKLYIAGPMRGFPRYNFTAFEKSAAELRAAGYEVTSPAEMDVAVGFDPTKDIATDEFVEEALERDRKAIHRVGFTGGVALLDGWQKSAGTAKEIQFATSVGCRIATVQFWLEAAKSGVFIGETNNVTSSEVRVTDKDTGGQKGMKLERFDLIPVEPLEEIARVYGRGAQKYADDNWRKGYSWKLSFGAMMRHAWLFWRGESRDAETGCHHLACAAWHCLTLMWFEKNHPNKDDRKDKPQ